MVYLDSWIQQSAHVFRGFTERFADCLRRFELHLESVRVEHDASPDESVMSTIFESLSDVHEITPNWITAQRETDHLRSTLGDTLKIAKPILGSSAENIDRATTAIVTALVVLQSKTNDIATWNQVAADVDELI